MLSGTLMIVGVPVVTFMHSSGCSVRPLLPYRPHSYSSALSYSSTSTDPPCHNQRKLSYVAGTPLRPPLLYVGLSHIHMHVRIHACQPTHLALACLVYVCMADRSWHNACKVYARQDIVAPSRAGLGRVGLPRTRFRVRAWHRANGRGDTAVLRLSHDCLDTLCVGPLGQFKSSCMMFLSFLLLFSCVCHAMVDHSTNFQVG